MKKVTVVLVMLTLMPMKMIGEKICPTTVRYQYCKGCNFLESFLINTFWI